MFVLFFLMRTDCGSLPGVTGESNANLTLVVQNPDPNATGGTSKGVSLGKEIVPSSDISVAKATATGTSCINQCNVTVSASDMTTISKSFDVTCGASSVSLSVSIPSGASRTLGVECIDTTLTTSDNHYGYNAETSLDISSKTTASLSAKFLNLGTDGSGDTTGSAGYDIHYLKVSHPNTTQTLLTWGFRQSFTDTQKGNFLGYASFDTDKSGSRSNQVDSNRDDGKTTDSLGEDFYFKVEGGIAQPKCTMNNSSGSGVFRGTGAWAANGDGNTEIKCTFTISQFKSVDSDQKAKMAAVACDRTLGASADCSDAIPNSGFIEQDLSRNTSYTLKERGSADASCTNGEDCSSGFCSFEGACISLTAPSLSATLSTLADVSAYGAPLGLAINPAGTKIYVTTDGHKVLEVNASTGAVSVLAGSGAAATTDGTGTAAAFNTPHGITVSSDGANLYLMQIGGSDDVVRKIVVATQAVTTFSGTPGANDFANPRGITYCPGGLIFVGDTNNHRIVKIVESTGVRSVLAGGTQGSTNGTGTAAQFNAPRDLVCDSTGTYLYVADVGNHLVRKIYIPTQEVTTLAGSGTAATTDGTGTAAAFNSPLSLDIDPTDTFLVVSTSGTTTVRKIVIDTQVVTTLANVTTGNANVMDCFYNGTACFVSTGAGTRTIEKIQ